jgi:putative RNA 2'-phosphotransferase
MNERERTRTSKFLSLVLRHEPEKFGLRLDSAGWVDVEVLLASCGRHGHPLSRAELDEVVTNNDKKRFALSEDGRRIRASQGHSIEVSLGYEPQTPPARLFHGTASRFLPSIRANGLNKGERHHVHLSLNEATALQVGSRRGDSVILAIDAAAMAAKGHQFFLSANGVWLTDHVPAEFIEFPTAQPGKPVS